MNLYTVITSESVKFNFKLCFEKNPPLCRSSKVNETITDVSTFFKCVNLWRFINKPNS